MYFFTGFFSLSGFACQKVHNEMTYDDDVVSNTNESITLLYDGYVSNCGTIATIHIKPGYSDDDIASVKRMFGLFPGNGITEVNIVEFE